MVPGHMDLVLGMKGILTGCPRPGKIRENREFCAKKFPAGKIREFGKMGKIREFYKNMSGKYQGIFSSTYIMIVSPFSRIYIRIYILVSLNLNSVYLNFLLS